MAALALFGFQVEGFEGLFKSLEQGCVWKDGGEQK